MSGIGVYLERVAFYMLVAVSGLVPLAMGGVTAWGLLALRFGVGVSIATWVLSAVARGRLTLPRRLLTVPLLVYIVTVVASAMLSPYAYASRQATLNVLLDAGAFLVAATLLTSRARLRTWLAMTLVVSSIMVVQGVAQYLGLDATPSANPARISSFFFNSNHFSGYLALVTPLVSSLLLGASRALARVTFGLLLAGLLFNLMLTFSWGLPATLVAVLAMILWWGILRVSRRLVWRAVTVTLVVGLVGLWGLVGLTPQVAGKTLRTRTGEFINTWVRPSFNARVNIDKGSLSLIRAHPLFGVGPGNFAVAFPRYQAADILRNNTGSTDRYINYAHNDYAQVASESGLVALAAYLAFWVLLLGTGIRKAVSGRFVALQFGVTAGLLALMLHGLTDGNMTVVPGNAMMAYTFGGVLYGISSGGSYIRSSTSPSADARDRLRRQPHD